MASSRGLACTEIRNGTLKPPGPAGGVVALMDGSQAEDTALRFLSSADCACWARNWRCKLGELDLVMQERRHRGGDRSALARRAATGARRPKPWTPASRRGWCGQRNSAARGGRSWPSSRCASDVVTPRRG
jgi:hypothetical protein